MVQKRARTKTRVSATVRCRQWLKWLGEKVFDVADQMEEEQRQFGSQAEQSLATTEELGKARAQIRSLEEDIKRSEECTAIMANRGQITSAIIESVPLATLHKEAPETEAQPVVSTTQEKDAEREKEISTLREELAAQEALWERERAQKQTSEEEKRRLEENLRKSHANNNRLKEEREKLLQEKVKLQRMAETVS